MMILQERRDIDTRRWDEMVTQSKAAVFSRAAYLDAVSDNWCILWNDDLSGGIACPYSVKLGVKVLYAPFFHRCIEWVGNNEPRNLTDELRRRFCVAEAHLRSDNELPFPSLHHQIVTDPQFKPNQQAKRMLKKAFVYTVEERTEIAPLLNLLRAELSGRINGIHDHSLGKLRILVNSFAGPDIVQLNLIEDGVWQGGIWLLPFKDRMVYLKGTVSADARENGGMYLLMETAIRGAFSEGMVFDFGGSNAPGVRRFNMNWGAEDADYYHLRWNNAPLWWKMLKKLRSAWKRK
jgi:hypothetical protein